MNERESFIRHFREIQPKFSRLFTRILLGADLTLPQYAVLTQLVQGGTMSMSGMSEKLAITKPAVTKLVDRLEAAHFLKRASHPEDRRIFNLEILPKGERVVRQTQARVLNVLLKTVNQFDSTGKKMISKFYASLSRNLDEVLERR